LSSGESGGTRHEELARYLTARGHQVVVVAGQTSYLTGRKMGPAGMVSKERTQGGFEIIRCATHSKIHRSFADRLAAFFTFVLGSFLVSLWIRNVDVVWGTSPPLFQAGSALAVARLKRVPFVFEVRDLWPDFAIQLGVLKHPAGIRFGHWLERLLYRSADLVMPNSPGYVPHIVQRGGDEARIQVVPNGVDVRAFDVPPDPGFRHRLGLENKIIALYSGALGYANDLETLLEASKQLVSRRDIAVVILGDGKERHRLQRQAEDMGLSNVVFASARPKSEMAPILASVDICVATLRDIPLFATPYPNKVFDYMAAGKPVVLAIDGAIREVVEAAGGGVFSPPGDAEALAATIARLADDGELRQHMGASGRGYVAQYFDRRLQGEMLERLLQELAPGAARPEKIRGYPGKRSTDVLLATVALILCSPLLVLTAASVWLFIGRPVIYRQTRAGAFGRPFQLLKFRSMTEAFDEEGRPLPDDRRLTRLGRRLRAWSLDELPELVNVLRGDMSLVGPRPLVIRYLDRYSSEQMRRHHARPGITGLSQVSGRNAISWEEKFKLDVWYVNHISPWLDARILMRTLLAIARRHGVSQPGQATMEEFLGNRPTSQ
ncbi:MAG TPA: sugar transferase, partial [Chloroflexota bacterium]|nr:sugar transferase [Chloroflexota bacterium]